MSNAMVDERWRTFWSGMTSPRYAEETESHYRACAAELRLLIDDVSADRVLEVGCGNGSLYPHLGFDSVRRYLGVDFSANMLDAFRARYPDVELVHADGASFRPQEEFDLVFSSQVAQYWSVAALRQHVDNAFAVLADDGTLVVSGIPWSRMRRAYAWGDLTGGPRRSAPVAGLNYLHSLVRGTMGRWYDYPLIRSIAESRQLQVRFFGSLHYPYRFHAVLRRRADRRASYCS